MADAKWRPLLVRERGEEPKYDALADGVPAHLIEPLIGWLKQPYLTWWDRSRQVPMPYKDRIQSMGLRLRISLDWLGNEYSALTSIEMQFRQFPVTHLLNAVDLALYDSAKSAAGSDAQHAAKTLDSLLQLGGSAWCVGPDQGGLVRRVSPEARAAAATVVNEGARAGALIGEAWKHVYGTNPSPTIGYREAVRAVEAAACPVILANDKTATLGKAITALRDAPPGKFITVFTEAPGRSVESIRKLMELIWKNQFDRHGTADENIPLTVSQAEAEAALHAAVTLVLWFNRGFITKAVAAP